MSNERRTITINCPHCQSWIRIELNSDQTVSGQPSRLVPVPDNSLSEEDVLRDDDPSLP
jgi:hypothetical protein